MAGGAGELTLEYTPTWVVAIVCSVMVVISLIVERLLHKLGKLLKKKNQKPLYDALQKVKEELMLLGFISLLLTVFQDTIAKICIPPYLATTWLPCDPEAVGAPKILKHVETSFFSVLSRHRNGRRLLASNGVHTSVGDKYCTAQKMVPLLSTTALHHLHIFIFALAVSHVFFCALTCIFGGMKIRQWRQWEDEILAHTDPNKPKITNVQEHDFIKSHYQGVGKRFALIGWVEAFLKQFHGSVHQADYTTLRLGFIMSHCKGHPKFDFHNYLMRSFEADFKKVVGISWYLWAFVVIFLLLNVHDWHAYFYIAFIPIILLLAVGTKLEHIMTQLACEVGEKHMAVEGELVVKPSDDLFWFSRPRLVLRLIHIVLFQNSFELAMFFWMLAQYGMDACIMGDISFVILRLIIGLLVQFLNSYSTLPLYALVAQMGSSFKKAIFNEHIQASLVSWAKMAKKNQAEKRKHERRASKDSNSVHSRSSVSAHGHERKQSTDSSCVTGGGGGSVSGRHDRKESTATSASSRDNNSAGSGSAKKKSFAKVTNLEPSNSLMES